MLCNDKFIKIARANVLEVFKWSGSQCTGTKQTIGYFNIFCNNGTSIAAMGQGCDQMNSLITNTYSASSGCLTTPISSSINAGLNFMPCLNYQNGWFTGQCLSSIPPSAPTAGATTPNNGMFLSIYKTLLLFGIIFIICFVI